QKIHWFDAIRFSPHIYALERRRDPATFMMGWEADSDTKIPVRFFAQDYEYKLLGLIPTDLHLIGIDASDASDRSLFLLGTDEQGRDMWSRLMYATRISMSIGLVGVFLSLVLGIVLGGVSGFYGGMVDSVIQRVIEIVRSILTIPLWMGLAAAVP